MNTRYFDTPRLEILPWLPQNLERLLDIGCGTGATTRLIKERFPQLWSAGVEYDESIAQQAKPVFNQLWTGDVGNALLEASLAPGSLDLVLCLDVLEHLVDPWSLIKRVSPFLKPGGRVIISVPNIRNWKFLWRLTTKGDFHYKDSGLLDRTHLRFFVRATAIDLGTCGDLNLVAAIPAQKWGVGDARFWLSLLSYRVLDEFMAKQWLIVVEKG